jgi:hypothetical protein
MPSPKERRCLFNRNGILLLGIAFFSALLPVQVLADSDYKFVDEYGDEVLVPTDIPMHTERTPGKFSKEAASHKPKVAISTRYDGLETIRIVDMVIPHEIAEGEEIKIYLTDKDGLVVGYKRFSTGPLKGRFKINGVINYLQIYVICPQHEGWHYEIRI